MDRNCCKNCTNACDYTGWYDFYCNGYNQHRRAEKYDCPKFIDNEENTQEYNFDNVDFKDVEREDIECLRNLSDTKKLTDKQRKSLKRLIQYYMRNH